MITRRSFIKGVAAAIALPSVLLKTAPDSIPVSIGGTGACSVTGSISLDEIREASRLLAKNKVSPIKIDGKEYYLIYGPPRGDRRWFARLGHKGAVKFNGEMELGAVR